MTILRQTDELPTFVHMPTPTDHYSAATGSAIMTVIYEIACRHDAHGGRSQIVVGRNTRHDYPVGECLEVDFPALPTKKQKIIDAALGRLGMPRPFVRHVYAPARTVLDRKFDGPLLVHNAPGVLPLFRELCPNAQICLYAHNALFGGFTPQEARRMLAAADRVICVSQFIAEDVQAHLGEASKKVVSVNNGVDIQRFQPSLKLPDAEIPLILFIGRVVPQKGPDLLLKAAQKLQHSQRRFKVRIVGSSGFSATDPLSPYEVELRRIAESLGEAVEFQPFVDRVQVLEHYHQASIFCAPSNWDEPCTLTVPEALACGLPTVASRRGGIPEVGGDAVLYFQPPDVDMLAEQLAFFLDDERVRREWSARARAQAQTLSWERQYQKLCQALSTHVQRRGVSV